jgi:hypothetical protein
MTQAFNLSQLANNVNTSGQLNAAAGLYNQVPVANGGTGAATLTANAVLIGNGTSAVTAVAASTAGNVLTSNGTTWVSQIASGGTPIVRSYTSPATWTKPATLKAVKVSVVGGGGSGAARSSVNSNTITGGAAGGISVGFIQASAGGLAGPVAITVPSGGAAVGPFPSPNTGSPGNAGGTSSFGSLVTATGGAAGVYNSAALTTPGAGTSTLAADTTASPYVAGYNSLAYPTVFIAAVNGVPGVTYGQHLMGGMGVQLGFGAPSGGASTGFGAGGSAPAGSGTPSAAGRPGLIIVEEFY